MIMNKAGIANLTEQQIAELIAGIYREILCDQTLNADSDFFEAGGDSLTAFQITARIQAELGAEVPVGLVFAYPSPADLATVVDLPTA
jgi:acyl carrier protein